MPRNIFCFAAFPRYFITCFYVVFINQAKEVEKKAIEEGIKENGREDTDKVVKAVLANRHAQVTNSSRESFILISS